MAANGVSGPHGTDAAAWEPAPPPVDLGRPSFSEVLRALNPLQYVPVVGTIYRLATGDAAPVGLRMAVSAVAGVLTGGPVGLLGSILGGIAEQMFHVEDRVREALAAETAAGAVAAGAPAHAQVAAGPAAPPVGAASAADAYRAAGLLGAV